MINWFDIVPYDVAIAQRAWDRRSLAYRAKQSGLTQREIGNVMGISASRVHQMLAVHRHRDSRRLMPAERYWRPSETRQDMRHATLHRGPRLLAFIFTAELIARHGR